MTAHEIFNKNTVQTKKDGITNIPISQLKAFVDHPFKVLDDERKQQCLTHQPRWIIITMRK